MRFIDTCEIHSDPSGHGGRTGVASIGLAITVVVALVAAACGGSGHGTNPQVGAASTGLEPQSGGVLVVGVRAETNGWSPALDTWADTGNLEGSTVFEPLASTGVDTGAKPWLAKSWIADTTFTRWVINLQSGITFQDGEPFNADAVVDNFNAYLAGPYSSLATGPMFKDAKALDDSTVQIDLTQPWAAFPSSNLVADYMMAPSMIRSGATGASHPIGTGPFTFDTWQPNDFFRVKRNPNYWGGRDPSGKVRAGQGLPHLDAIQFRVITDDSTRTAALQSGDLNMEFTTNARDAAKLASGFNEARDWESESEFVIVNAAPTVDGKPNPLSNIDARLALAYASNPKAIAAQVGAGVKVPTSPWRPTSPWGLPSDENGFPSYDLTKAKAEVAKYEQETGAKSLTFTLSGLPSIDVGRTLQQLQAQWKEAGITVNIETEAELQYITQIVSGAYEAAFIHNYGYPDPDQENYFLSSSTIQGPGKISINFAHYGTPQIDHDLSVGRTSGFPNQRKAAYDDLAVQLNKGAVNIWLYNTPYTLIASKKVHGLDSPGGPTQIRFGNYSPKTWWAQIWLSS